MCSMSGFERMIARAVPNPGALARRRIAVVCGGQGACARGRCRARVELRELIVGERLGREEVQGAAAGVGEEALQHGQVVAEGLAAGGGGGNGNVLAAQRSPDGGGLVTVERIDAAGPERGTDARIEAVGDRFVNGGPGSQPLPAHHIAHEARVQAQRLQRRFDRHGRIIPDSRRAWICPIPLRYWPRCRENSNSPARPVGERETLPQALTARST